MERKRLSGLLRPMIGSGLSVLAVAAGFGVFKSVEAACYVCKRLDASNAICIPKSYYSGSGKTGCTENNYGGNTYCSPWGESCS